MLPIEICINFHSFPYILCLYWNKIQIWKWYQKMVHIQFIVHTHYLWTMAEEDLFFIQCPPIFKTGASQLTSYFVVMFNSDSNSWTERVGPKLQNVANLVVNVIACKSSFVHLILGPSCIHYTKVFICFFVVLGSSECDNNRCHSL